MKKKIHILLVEDDEAALFGYTKYLQGCGYTIESATNIAAAKEYTALNVYDAILLDLKLPDGNTIDWISELRGSHEYTALIVITGSSDIPTAVKAIKQGADNFLTKPVQMDDLVVALEKSLEVKELRKKNSQYKQLVSKKSTPFWGNSARVQQMLELAHIAASNNAVTLLTGETGTGKGVLARWIHDYSVRKSEGFVELNCSTLKGELLRSELFGHAKGAFTSAIKDRAGLIELADSGTLFLDEIGDMNIEVQAQLLKTIEEKTYRRIGENRIRTSDFRLICATNKNLEKCVEEKTFRSDLYYRICVFPIQLPSLRNTIEDLPGLITHLLATLGYPHISLPSELISVLGSYPWPGNIRELRNMLERAVVLAQGSPLHRGHFPGLISNKAETVGSEAAWDLEEMERQHIQKALKFFNNDKYRTSHELGISLSSLYRKLEKIRETSPDSH